MKRLISSPSAFVFLFLLISLIGCNDLINKTCKRTPHFDLCISSLLSNPQSSTATVKGLASIMANITLLNATDTLNYIQELINQTTDPEVEKPLTYCAEDYIPVVKYILPQAINALSNGKYGFAGYGISYAGQEVDACEKGLSKSIKYLLTDRNLLMHNLTDVTAAMVNILQKG